MEHLAVSTTAKPRRTRGDGSVFPDPRGTGYVGQIKLTDVSGDTKRRTVRGPTRLAVVHKLTELRRQSENGTLLPPNHETVREYLDRYLELANLGAATRKTYQSIARRFVFPQIGTLQVRLVTPAHIEMIYEKITVRNVRAFTHSFLSRAFDRAVRLRKAVENPCAFVDAPLRTSARRIPMTHEQAMQLIASVRKTPHYALVLTAALTGMREGELFGLQQEDVDLVSGKIHVRHALKEIHGQLYLQEPKTALGTRVIDLPQLAVDALREHLERPRRHVSKDVAGYVFLSKNGRQLRRSNFCRTTWPNILKAAGLPRFPFHSLRHTMASLLLVANVHPKVVQERVGHASISTTMDTYSHMMPSLQKEAAEKLNGMFSR
jgi:integrase